MVFQTSTHILGLAPSRLSPLDPPPASSHPPSCSPYCFCSYLASLTSLGLPHLAITANLLSGIRHCEVALALLMRAAKLHSG